ncbi:hypothetical protein [Amycolatopsis sp. CA-230715]|uniref:hypothetical protein n=1 Tax=Amycolatopsis sp. CA-230715 TaxID=2745196 RepID=UPI001C00C52C|nr:hypothetical protein [Amycolatopsis sp. CA-230715]QWF78673.1 hypothetical protein HUW46_02071 [Amycolatopsis sp. CA-230715]
MTTAYDTHDVFHALRSESRNDPRRRVGSTFNLDTEAEFRDQAASWLRDEYRLPTDTIGNADWTEVYQYFKTLNDPQAAANVAEDWIAKPRGVRAVQLTEDNFQRVRAWIETAGGDVVWTGQNAAGRKSMTLYAVDGEEDAWAGHYIVHDPARQEWRISEAAPFVADYDHQTTGR